MSDRIRTKLNFLKRRSLIAITLVALYLGSVGYRHLERPVLPPMRSPNDATTSLSSGVEMAIPAGWYLATPPTNDASILAFSTPRSRTKRATSRTQRKPRISVRVGSAYYIESGKTSLAESDLTFLGREATLFAGRATSGLSLFQNLHLAWKSGSFENWKRPATYACWHIEFRSAGRRCSLSYSVPCGRFAHVDGRTIPPELMSYFETIAYEPAETPPK